MSQIAVFVNKTNVTNSEEFRYSCNVAFSNLEIPNAHIVFKMFFPSKISYTLPGIPSDRATVREVAVLGGTRIEVDFGLMNAGTSLNFTMQAWFDEGRIDGDSFTNVSQLYIDGEKYMDYTAETVHLDLTENFLLEKRMQPANPFPGETVDVSLIINNIEEAGGKITDVVFTDTLPSGLVPDTTFDPIGRDLSQLQPYDPTYDNLTGSWSGNTMNFTLPSFIGSSYMVSFKAKVDGDLEEGTTITNTANWSVSGEARQSATSSIRVEGKAPQPELLAVSKTGPEFALSGDEIVYEVCFDNISDVDVTNIVIEDTIPLEVDIKALRLAAQPNLSAYSVYIATSEAPDTLKKVVDNVTGSTLTLDLSAYISDEIRIVYIKLEATGYTASGGSSDSSALYLMGTVNDTAQLEGSFRNTVLYKGESQLGETSGTAFFETAVQATSTLDITKTITPAAPYRVLDEITVNLSYGGGSSALRNPVFIDVLPPQLEYINGSETFRLFDTKTARCYYSNTPEFPIPTPIFEYIENFPNEGQNTVRWDFDGVDIPYSWGFEVSFKALIAVGSEGSFSNYGYLGNKGDDVQVAGALVVDENDLDRDGLSEEEIAISNGVSGEVLPSEQYVFEKVAKGDLAESFSITSSTTSGGKVDYQIRVLNNQPNELKNIEVVDILPYVGDTGVISTNTQRLSEFEIYLTNLLWAEVRNVATGQISEVDEIAVEYSKSCDPVRFGKEPNTTIGTIDDWSTVPPVDRTQIKAIKVTTVEDFVLAPYEELIISFGATTPVGIEAEKSAYNSFAVRALINEGEEEAELLPIEVASSQLTIEEENDSSIGGFVWDDLNEDGFKQADEVGVNGIVVECYNTDMNLIASTITANNSEGEAGYYSLNSLDGGEYFIKFTPIGGYELTIKPADAPNASKPDPITKLTDAINLEEGQVIDSVGAGVVLRHKEIVINAEDRCIYVGDEFDPLEGVTAFDYNGKPLAVTVVENNVDNTIAGVYTVTYEAVSLINGKRTTKTIEVKVCPKNGRYQAITDIFQSVALEEAALSHIINAEGEKIQKAVELELSNQEMIEINSSVKDMISAISNLEIVLQEKLNLFSGCDIYEDSCCDEFLG